MLREIKWGKTFSDQAYYGAWCDHTCINFELYKVLSQCDSRILMTPFSTSLWEIDSLEPFLFPNSICRCSQYRNWQRNVGHPEGTSIGYVFEYGCGTSRASLSTSLRAACLTQIVVISFEGVYLKTSFLFLMKSFNFVQVYYQHLLHLLKSLVHDNDLADRLHVSNM